MAFRCNRATSQTVEKALERHQSADYRVRVVDDKDAVEKRHGIWFVVVEPTREDVESYEFGARMAAAGADLMEQDDVPIQLTTVLPQYGA